jgi:hypothetical protein
MYLIFKPLFAALTHLGVLVLHNKGISSTITCHFSGGKSFFAPSPSFLYSLALIRRMIIMSERDAELAKRTKKGDAICRQLLPPLMGSSAVLDGTMESLRGIDAKAGQLRGVVGILDSVGESPGASALVSREAVAFMLGAYLGELVKREAEARGAKARWEASGKGAKDLANASLVIIRGQTEARWRAFLDTQRWLKGQLDVTLEGAIKQLV